MALLALAEDASRKQLAHQNCFVDGVQDCRRHLCESSTRFELGMGRSCPPWLSHPSNSPKLGLQLRAAVRPRPSARVALGGANINSQSLQGRLLLDGESPERQRLLNRGASQPMQCRWPQARPPGALKANNIRAAVPRTAVI